MLNRDKNLCIYLMLRLMKLMKLWMWSMLKETQININFAEKNWVENPFPIKINLNLWIEFDRIDW